MNFNGKDSLTFTEVLNNPMFLDFLRKWELNRRPSAVRALFGCKEKSQFHLLIFKFALELKLNFSFFFFLMILSHPDHVQCRVRRLTKFTDSESPAMSLTGAPNPPDADEGTDDLPNQISAAYEVPQFPIEQIEKKLMLQRHLTAK